MNEDVIVRFVEALIRNGVTQADMELIARSHFAGRKASYALRETTGILAEIGAQITRKSEMSLDELVEALGGLNSDIEALVKFDRAKSTYGRNIRRRNLDDLMT